MKMFVEETIDTIKMYAEQCSRLLPEVEEIQNFEKTVIQFNQLIFSNSDVCAKINRKETVNFKETYLKLDAFDISNLKQKTGELLKLKGDIDELSKKVDSAYHIYETKVHEKAKIDSTLKKQQLEKDRIAAFKIGTLSHFSFSSIIKFGYFFNRNTLDFKPFSYDPDKEPSEQEIQITWDLLKLFINK